jgi:cysteine-rich secretory family protein
MAMKRHFKNLFTPHHGNNHKAKILHHQSLSKLVLFILFFQVLITGFVRVKPGILGYASNISVQKVLELTNQNRQTENLQSLTISPILSDSARQKAAHMFANNYWAHNAPDETTPWDFFNQVGYNYLYAGENLARDFGDSNGVIKAWMESPTHRDNIMSGRYTEIGIAVVNGLLNGQETTLVVQHFGKPSAVAAEIPAQAAVETKPQVAGDTQKIPSIAVAEPVENVIEEISQTDGANKLFPTQIISQVQPSTTPYISAFDLTKGINIALSIVVILVLALDGFLIFSRKTQRRSGKNFVHLSLFTLVMLILILTGSGKII